MFTGVPRGQHSMKVRCTSTNDPTLMATATVTGLQFLDVTLTLETAGTSITILLDTSIEATHQCSLDNGIFVDCKPSD